MAAVDGARVIRLVLADDDPLVRMGLGMLLAGDPEIEIVAEAADGAEAVAAVRAHGPDVVLVDIRMPVMDGLAATERLRALPEPPHVIVLTTFDADEQIVRALRAGASGFLLKDTPPAEIVRAIHVVASGEALLSPAVTRRLIAHIADDETDARRRAAAGQIAALTDRERDVAVALGRGMTNAEISRELYMSVPTVKVHVSRTMAKLDLNNRVQVALLVHDAGLA
nr:response regulator transcription factor [Miltoncostaea oceani]